MTTTTFEPATATRDFYQALYVLNDGSDKKIRAIVQNILNVLKDPRLADKLFVALLAFGDGIELFRHANPYAPLLQQLTDKGVVLVQCANTLTSRGIDTAELHPSVQLVPSANGEIILRQYEGWAVVKP